MLRFDSPHTPWVSRARAPKGAYLLLGLIAGRAPLLYEQLVSLGRALASWCVMTEGLTGGEARSMDDSMLGTLERRIDTKTIRPDDVLRD